jgi:putative protease
VQIELELLAPAKNKDIGIAAIDCGADALYIAGPSFGARESAGNPMSDVAELVTYAHKYGVRVYLVINTILYDNELQQVKELAWQAYNCGCDALIVQDMGLLKMELPPIPLFASTQTNIRTVEQAQILSVVGFKRLILARELDFKAIKSIKDHCNIEIETFIHGALCVSYSGQCYMSSRISNRSANRGECMQACRLKYDLLDSEGNVLAKDAHLLSLKDFNAGRDLFKLIEAGVTSFKIEGRLKNISYIRNVVSYYNLLLQEFVENNSSYRRSSFGKSEIQFTPDPEKTFNRGFTKLFLNTERGQWLSEDSAKGKGEFIGLVKSVEKDKFGNLVFCVDTDKKLNNGDGLFLVSKRGKESGVRASVVIGSKIYTNEKIAASKGDKVYRNFDFRFEKELETKPAKRYISAEINFSYDGSVTRIEAIAEGEKRAIIESRDLFDVANRQELVLKNISNQLSKKSGIITFNLKSISGDNLPFYPVAFLNDIRRQLAEMLEKEYAPQRAEIKADRTNVKHYNLSKQNYTYLANISNKLSEKFYKNLGANSISPAFEIEKPQEVELMRCKYCIKSELGFCPKEGGKSIKSPLYLVNGDNRFRVEFDCIKCEMIIYG